MDEMVLATIFASVAIICLTVLTVVRPRNVFMMSRGDVTITFKSTMPLDEIVNKIYIPLVEFTEENVIKWEEHVRRIYSQFETQEEESHECGECKRVNTTKAEPSGSMFL